MRSNAVSKPGGTCVLRSVTALAGWLVFGLWTLLHFPNSYARVQVGDTVETVRALFLCPPSVRPGSGKTLYWEGTPRGIDPSECVQEYWYRLPLPFAFFGDPQWTIGFDTTGKVISKYHYESE